MKTFLFHNNISTITIFAIDYENAIQGLKETVTDITKWSHHG
jgi:hypothetical protein